MKKLTDLIAKYGDKEIDETKFKELFDIKDSKVFVPKMGERYCFVDEEGYVADYIFDNDALDRNVIEHNTVYRTRKEAEFACEAQAFKVKMKRDFAKNSDELDWGDIIQKKYYLYFDYKNKVFGTYGTSEISNEGTLYTTNKEWLEQYIDDNEADIKKYVFGIKEDE